jgi:hypothetical protein
VIRDGFLLILLLAAASAAAQTTHADGPFVHPASGMVLPENVGDFMRFRESRGGDNAVSAAYGYAGREGRISATLIVFLPPDEPTFCKDYIDAGRQALLGSRGNVRVLDPPDVPVLEGFPAVNGAAARFDFGGNANNPPLRSDQYYYCNVAGKWVVQYDFAYPADFDAAPEIASFFHDLKVTISDAP